MNHTLRLASDRLVKLMQVRPWAPRAAALALSMLLLGAVLGAAMAEVPGRSQSVPSAGTTSISVTALSAGYTFDPNAISNVATHTLINVSFTDADGVAHTFSIIDREGVVIPSTADVASLAGQYGLLIGLNASSAGTVTGSFTSPGVGWYEFVCLEPGHFDSGMYGFIAFGEAVPSNLSVSSSTPGPGLAVFIIVGTIVALVVIALVLGFVIGQRRGAQHEMPPERLGYPEPVAPPAETPSAADDPSLPKG